MLKTIRKNSVRRTDILLAAKNIKKFTLDNCFNGEPIEGFVKVNHENHLYYNDQAKIYTLHIHSNKWFEFTV